LETITITIIAITAMFCCLVFVRLLLNCTVHESTCAHACVHVSFLSVVIHDAYQQSWKHHTQNLQFSPVWQRNISLLLKPS